MAQRFLANFGLAKITPDRSNRDPDQDNYKAPPLVPHQYWTSTSDSLVIEDRSFLNTVYRLNFTIPSEDYSKTLIAVFGRVASHVRKDGELVQLTLNFEVSQNWSSILKHISNLLIDQSKQIDYISFNGTDLSWDHLNDLYEVYKRLYYQKTFPFITIDLTDAEEQTSKKLVKDMLLKDEMKRGFFKKIISDEKNLLSRFYN